MPGSFDYEDFPCFLRNKETKERYVPPIGTLVNVLTVNSMRYEGILLVIDRQARTIALGLARCFGTAKRITQNIVPPLKEPMAYLIFRVEILKMVHHILHRTPDPPFDPPRQGLKKPGTPFIPFLRPTRQEKQALKIFKTLPPSRAAVTGPWNITIQDFPSSPRFQCFIWMHHMYAYQQRLEHGIFWPLQQIKSPILSRASYSLYTAQATLSYGLHRIAHQPLRDSLEQDYRLMRRHQQEFEKYLLQVQRVHPIEERGYQKLYVTEMEEMYKRRERLNDSNLHLSIDNEENTEENPEPHVEASCGNVKKVKKKKPRVTLVVKRVRKKTTVTKDLLVWNASKVMRKPSKQTNVVIDNQPEPFICQPNSSGQYFAMGRGNSARYGGARTHTNLYNFGLPKQELSEAFPFVHSNRHYNKYIFNGLPEVVIFNAHYQQSSSSRSPCMKDQENKENWRV